MKAAPPFPVGDIFYLVLLQGTVGAFWLYALVPVRSVGSGFFLTTTRPFWLALLVGLLAHGGGRWETWPGIFESLAAGAFFLALTLYLAGVWLGRPAWEYGGWLGGSLMGLVALGAAARFFLGPSPSGLLLWGVLQSFFSALVLGGVTLSMLLGHWYLVVPKLSVEPFRRLVRVLLGSLEGLALVVALGLLWASGSEVASRVEVLTDTYLIPWSGRILFGWVGTFVLSLMAKKTLEIPHTQAATGLLYLAILFALAGELWGRYLLLVTRLPL